MYAAFLVSFAGFTLLHLGKIYDGIEEKVKYDFQVRPKDHFVLFKMINHSFITFKLYFCLFLGTQCLVESFGSVSFVCQCYGFYKLFSNVQILLFE